MRPETGATGEKWTAPSGSPTPSTQPPGQPNPELAAALAEFQQAVAGKKAGHICAAYQLLRKAGAGMKLQDLLRLADQALGQPALNLIVSAFSHYHCFMCNGGTMRCDQCHGSGFIDDNRPCPICDGLGLDECEFCRGTGWADRDVIPTELRRGVLTRQFQHVREDVQHLVKTFMGMTTKDIANLDPAHRRELAAWLLRLRGRLNDLLKQEAPRTNQERAHFASVAAKIDQCLKILWK